jgi:CelD/BcsL family acetyltransferase involved in cellulose biosynthesis
LSNILNEFSTPENSYSFVSYLNKKAIAASYVLYNKDTAYYLLGGYDPSNKHNGAGVMALFNAIMEAKKRGIKNFDFEGSMLPEVEKYFRAFGGELVPYFTVNKAKFLIEVLLKKSKRELF